MDKLHYIMQQTDRMLLQCLKEVENHIATVLTAGTKKVIADTKDITSQVIACNEEEEDDKTEEDNIEEDGDGTVEVSILLIIALPVHALFYIHLL